MIIIIVLLYRPLSQWKRRSDLSSSFTVEKKKKKKEKAKSLRARLGPSNKQRRRGQIRIWVSIDPFSKL